MPMGNSASGGQVGQVSYFPQSSAPAGWLKANGAEVSRASYAALFAVIGTTFGAGDGSTTFKLPDLRGEFLRGLDDGRGVDSGRALGTAQADQIQGHRHRMYAAFYDRVGGAGTGAAITQAAGNNTSQTGGDAIREEISNGTNGTPRTGEETRPRNVAMLACIKYV